MTQYTPTNVMDHAVRPQRSVYLRAAFVLILATLLLSCTNSRKAPRIGANGSLLILKQTELEERRSEFEVRGEVEFVCSERTCARVSTENCWQGLLRDVELRNADAVVLLEEVLLGTGHGGGELVRVACRGLALRSISAADPVSEDKS